MDLLSIPNYLIKKGRPHGHRYGKTPEKKEYHQAHNLKMRCIKRGFEGIHDRFLKDPEFRASQLEHDRDVQVCIKMDDLADKDFSHYVMEPEYFRYKQNWWISLNKSGNTGPLRSRSDFNEALSTLNRLHQESGERQLRPMPSQAYAILEASATEPIIEFFLQLVAMEWFLVEFIIIQRKSLNEDACKAI